MLLLDSPVVPFFVMKVDLHGVHATMVAVPTGYKMVISRALGCMAFIDLNPQMHAPLGLWCNKCHTSLAPVI